LGMSTSRPVAVGNCRPRAKRLRPLCARRFTRAPRRWSCHRRPAPACSPERVDTLVVNADISYADVVIHDNDDVGLLARCGSALGLSARGSPPASATNASTFHVANQMMLGLHRRRNNSVLRILVNDSQSHKTPRANPRRLSRPPLLSPPLQRLYLRTARAAKERPIRTNSGSPSGRPA
jgi:hypothetical protein